jgi:hypothetical protein
MVSVSENRRAFGIEVISRGGDSGLTARSAEHTGEA